MIITYDKAARSTFKLYARVCALFQELVNRGHPLEDLKNGCGAEGVYFTLNSIEDFEAELDPTDKTVCIYFDPRISEKAIRPDNTKLLCKIRSLITHEVTHLLRGDTGASDLDDEGYWSDEGELNAFANQSICEQEADLDEVYECYEDLDIDYPGILDKFEDMVEQCN